MDNHCSSSRFPGRSWWKRPVTWGPSPRNWNQFRGILLSLGRWCRPRRRSWWVWCLSTSGRGWPLAILVAWVGCSSFAGRLNLFDRLRVRCYSFRAFFKGIAATFWGAFAPGWTDCIVEGSACRPRSRPWWACSSRGWWRRSGLVGPLHHRCTRSQMNSGTTSYSLLCKTAGCLFVQDLPRSHHWLL